MTQPEPILVVDQVSKSFPGVKALTDVSFSVGQGERGCVHALLGENGAGKSTLLKILSGAQKMDGGSIRFEGKPYEIETPREANEAGIVTIYQEFNLIPPLSIAENIFVGRHPKRGAIIDYPRMVREGAAVLKRIGVQVNPRKLVSELSVAEQQMVEIARALSMKSKLIIMDEPTSALSEAEVAVLMSIIEQLREEGVSVIFVTHRLKEVMRICDTYTVLRDGCLVESGRVADVTEADIVRLMVGRDIDRQNRRASLAHQTQETPALRVSGLRNVVHHNDPNAIRLKDLSFEAHYGEILGIGGLVGAGRTEAAKIIFGDSDKAGGTIEIDGKPVEIDSPMDAIAAGIGFVSEDRKQEGCFLDLSVGFNISIVALKAISNALSFVQGKREAALIEKQFRALNIRAYGAQQQIGNLSGGNQQKAILARWLAEPLKILIVDEPTRGIDIGAKSQIYQILFKLADSGVAIIVISSELPELMTISDRILVMCEGRRTALLNAADATEELLLTHMSGLQ